MKTFAWMIALLVCTTTVWAQQTPAQITREVLTDKTVVLTQYPDGTLNSNMHDSSGCLLFQYRFTAAQQEGIADDEYTEQIGFTIVPDKTGKFVLTGQQLQAAQAYFYKGCFCSDRGTFAIASGTIKGTRMSKTEWYINMNVTVKTGRGDNKQTVAKKMKGRYKIVSSN
jgi:hypothetical protein